MTAPLDLLGDGALALAADPPLLPALERWAWPLDALPRCGGRPRALVSVRAVPDAPPPPPATEPTFHARHMDAWVHEDSGTVTLASPDAAVWGRLDLHGEYADLRAHGGAVDGDVARLAVYGGVWMASALLLGRQGRVMIHAGAVVAPDGGAWLLAADTHGGKTTTCLNLIRAGWDYLSDDHVVVDADGATGALRVAGWRRRFHVDDGFEEGRSRGRRSQADPAGFGPGRWRASAPLAGILLPAVHAAAPTEAVPVHAAHALGRLIRHAPWLLADRLAAPALLAVLRRMAGHPAYALRLGSDTYADPRGLVRRLLHGMAGAPWQFAPR